MRRFLFAAPAALLFATTPAIADELADGLPSDLLEMEDEWLTGLNQPTGMAFLPDGRLVITQRGGQVRVRTTGGDLVDAGNFSVSTSFQEKGLLNVIAHPNFATSNMLYFYYTAGGGGGDQNRVVMAELSADNNLDTGSAQTIVEGIAAPLNHDGGGLAIYGDYLYVGTGDSGSNTNARPDDLEIGNYYPTCFTNLNGKVLRFNLDGSVPSDNPLVGATVDACGNSPGTAPSMTSTSPREEIFAWGFRNAYRLWADPLTGNVWVGHVGEITFEMINVIAPQGGEHHGWPFREGNDGAPASACEDVEPNVGACKDAVYRCESNNQMGDYDPSVPNDCNCVIGGLILTGCEWPDELEGHYVFGDYTSENVWTVQVNEERNDVVAERVDFASMQGGGPTSFLEYDGALYITVYGGSAHITRIAPQNPDASCDGPMTPNGGAGGEAAGGGGTSGNAGNANPGGAGNPQGGTGNGMAGNAPAAGESNTPGAGNGPGPMTPGGGMGSQGTAGQGAPMGNAGGGNMPPGPGNDPGPANMPGPAMPVTPGGPNPTPGATGTAGGAAGAVGVSDDASSDDGGCGCRVVGEQGPIRAPWSKLALGLGLALFAARRRRRV